MLLLGASRTAGAQAALWVEAAASSAQPPAAIAGATSSAYGLFGMRGVLPGRGWRLNASATFGNEFDRDEARWHWLDAGVRRVWRAPGRSFALAASAFSLGYARPFDYSAWAADAAPAFTIDADEWSIGIAPRGTLGGWSTDSIDGDIGVVGGALQLGRRFGALNALVDAEVHDASNGVLDGSYRGAGVDLSVTTGAWQLGGSVKRWRNPAESEWGWGGYVSVHASSRLSLDLRIARSVTDPVLASPGSLGVSAGVSWRLLSAGGTTPVARVAAARSAGRLVIFTLEADAQTAAVSGSFSGWTPIPMRRQGRKFTVEVVVEPGTHHYGFLLDGTDWHVPAAAPGLIDDGFGRRNATLVVEQM